MKKIIIALLATFGLSSVNSLADERLQSVYHPTYEGIGDRTVSIPEAPVPLLADNKVNVTCNLIYDQKKHTPLGIYYNNGKGSYKEKTIHHQTMADLSLTPGKYCIFALFTVYDSELPDENQYDFFTPQRIVMKEVDITENCILDFDLATATNPVNFDAKNPKGESLVLPLYDPKANPQWDFSESNILSVWRTSSIWHPSYGELYNLFGNDGARMSDGRVGSHNFDYLINDVNDQFTFAQLILSESAENEMHLISLAQKGLPGDNAIVSNDKTPFVIHEEKFVESPLYPSLRHELYNSEIQTYGCLNNFKLVGYKYVSKEKTPKFYASLMKTDDESINLSFQSTIKFFEEDYFIKGSTERNQLATVGCPLRIKADQMYYENPFNAYFNCPVEDFKGKMGNNVPVNALKMHSVNSAILYEPIFYGRWGEWREADVNTIKAEVRYNGEVVCDSYDKLDSWTSEWVSNGHAKGIINARFTSDNTLIGNITGINTVEVTYDENSVETCAPVLQFLTLRNTQGHMTDRFTAVSDASVMFTAGDFNGNGQSGQCQDVNNWTVEVAHYGQNDFVEVPVTRVIDMTSTSSWGVYSGSMKDIAIESTDGWYDIRVTLIDDAGNKSVQTISPAFKIGELDSSLDTAIQDSDAHISLSGRTISVFGMENPVVSVYSLDGQKVLGSTSAETDASALSAGVYVVSAVSDTDIVTAKIIIR